MQEDPQAEEYDDSYEEYIFREPTRIINIQDNRVDVDQEQYSDSEEEENYENDFGTATQMPQQNRSDDDDDDSEEEQPATQPVRREYTIPLTSREIPDDLEQVATARNKPAAYSANGEARRSGRSRKRVNRFDIEPATSGIRQPKARRNIPSDRTDEYEKKFRKIGRPLIKQNGVWKSELARDFGMQWNERNQVWIQKKSVKKPLPRKIGRPRKVKLEKIDYIVKDNKYECAYCNKAVRKQKNMTNLRKHLVDEHHFKF